MTRALSRFGSLIASGGLALAVLTLAADRLRTPPPAAPALQPPFDEDYTLTSIGVVPGDLRAASPTTSPRAASALASSEPPRPAAPLAIIPAR
jgi:hypothetical protein